MEPRGKQDSVEIEGIVDIGQKPAVARRAVAEGWVTLRPETLLAIVEGRVAKGDVREASTIAAIQAVKETPRLIPHCHPVPIESCKVRWHVEDGRLGCEVEVGKPQVAYRETITKVIEDEYTHKKQTGGARQFAKIAYTIAPGEVGTGFEFESKVTGGNVPREFWPAVKKGFELCIEEGVLAGYPVQDLKVTLMDGAFHAVDSSAVAFETAAKAAYRQSLPKAAPQLLEPIMKVDVFTPEDHVGDVIGDLNRRRAMIKVQE